MNHSSAVVLKRCRCFSDGLLISLRSRFPVQGFPWIVRIPLKDWVVIGLFLKRWRKTEKLNPIFTGNDLSICLGIPQTLVEGPSLQPFWLEPWWKLPPSKLDEKMVGIWSLKRYFRIFKGPPEWIFMMKYERSNLMNMWENSCTSLGKPFIMGWEVETAAAKKEQ